MSTRVFRKVAIALLVSTALTAAGAAPAQASRLRPGHNFEDPARNHAPGGIIASILHYFFEFAGGAMDPNGSH